MGSSHPRFFPSSCFSFVPLCLCGKAPALRTIMKDRFTAAAEQLLMELLAIQGVSGEEQAIMEFMAARLRAAGVGDEAIRFDQRRAPLSARRRSRQPGLQLPGTQPGPRRLLMAHADTVPLCRGARPVRRGRYRARRQTDRPGGRRSCRSGRDPGRGPGYLAVACPIRRWCFSGRSRRKWGSTGPATAASACSASPPWRSISTAGPADKLTIGATGGYRMDIHVRGRASHAGVLPEQGVSAITIAGLAIAQLHAEGWLGRIENRVARAPAILA